MRSIGSSTTVKNQKPTQKIKDEVVQKIYDLGLFYSSNISFEDTVKLMISFCKQNKGFKQWLKNKKK